MAKETIDAIRNAEMQAEQAEKDAKTKAEQIVLQAKKNAADLLKSTEQAEKAKEAQTLQILKTQEAGMLQEQMKETEKQTAALRLAAKDKEKQAVQTVLSMLAD